MAGGAGAAVKGISALTKWIIGGAAVVGTATIATVAILNSDQSAPAGNQQVKKDTVENAVQPNTSEVSDNSRIAQATPQTSVSPPHGTLTEDIIEVQPPILELMPENEPATTTNPAVPEYLSSKPESRAANPNPPVSQAPANPEGKTPSTNPATPENGSAGSALSAPVAAITRIPNTFTPNYDGDNDVFFVQSENITDFSVLILNAQGQQVYRSADPDFKWDGTDLSGNPVPNGQYKCVIIASGADNKPIKELQTVVIAR